MFPKKLNFVLPWLAAITHTAPADDEAFLKALEEETRRMEASSGVPSAPARPAAAAGERTQSEFEAMLKAHRGTFALYRRLQPKDQAEIFKAYREGADFQTIRQKIVSRRLHQ